ncbi:MAG: hypothetical protein Q8P13_02750 [bacterium]|nr:hypothetical protein [bacterium]
MTDTISNPCIRCGKERVRGKEKTLIMNTVNTVRYVYVCPDKDCQKIVEEELAAKAAKKLLLQTKKAPRAVS